MSRGRPAGGDEERQFAGFKAWFDARSLPYLEDALVDYSKDRMGASSPSRPRQRCPVDADSSLEDRINYVLYNEINPASSRPTAAKVSLVEVTDDFTRLLRWGGGCRGCSAVI